MTTTTIVKIETIGMIPFGLPTDLNNRPAPSHEKDAGKAEHNAAFVKLGLKPMLDQLKAINEDYEKKTASRAASQVANTLTPAKELRKQLDQYYEAFMMKIGALAIVSPNPELEAFVKTFNKLAKDTRERWKLHLAQLGLWTEEGGREEEGESPKAPTE